MTPDTPLEILWIHHTDMTPEQVDEYDRLDSAAFTALFAAQNSQNDQPNSAADAAPGEEQNDPNDRSTEWDSPDLHCFGFLDGCMVSHVGLVEREILIAGQPFTAAGVGGVCTHPDYQRRGYARVIMAEIRRAINDNPRAHLGMLFCASEMIHYYAACGWELLTEPVYALQYGSRVLFDFSCMILRKPGIPLPPGEIDLQHLPW